MSYQPDSPDPRTRDAQVPSDGQGKSAANETVQSSDLGGAHAESQRESYVDSMGNRVDSHAEVFEDTNQRRANIRYRIARITYSVSGVLEVILLLRLFFRLLGASRDNGFIMFLYGLSHVFVAPFNGIFNDQALGSRSVFEVSTLIAMLVYALLAWGIVVLGRTVFAPTLSGRQSITTMRRRRLL
jgi:hypothetical protein